MIMEILLVSLLTQATKGADCSAIFLHHHSVLQMSNKLPAKLFCCLRSDFLPLKRQSVKSADDLVMDTKIN